MLDKTSRQTLKNFIERETKRRDEIKRWGDYLAHSPLDELVAKARDLFVLIENESQGVVKFHPGISMWQEGIRTCYDFEGKIGSPITWYVEGTDELRANINSSSDVEKAISERLGKEDRIKKRIQVFRVRISPRTLEKYFRTHPRDFISSYNLKPYRVESAFNHIPALNRQLRVEGFPYPHRISSHVFAREKQSPLLE